MGKTITLYIGLCQPKSEGAQKSMLSPLRKSQRKLTDWIVKHMRPSSINEKNKKKKKEEKKKKKEKTIRRNR